MNAGLATVAGAESIFTRFVASTGVLAFSLLLAMTTLSPLALARQVFGLPGNDSELVASGIPVNADSVDTGGGIAIQRARSVAGTGVTNVSGGHAAREPGHSIIGGNRSC